MKDTDDNWNYEIFDAENLPNPPMMINHWRPVVTEEGGVTWKIVTQDLTGISDQEHTNFRARKSGDLDNVLKALQDSLQHQLYENDSQIVEYRYEDKWNPRAEIEFYQK